MRRQQQEVSPEEARKLNRLLLRIPAVLLVNSLLVPSAYIAYAVLWGCVLPWGIMGLISKVNK